MLAFMWTPWWGTAPDYIAALGTVGAFIAGLRLLRKELEARRDGVEDRRAAQARLVAAWVSPSHPEVDPDGSNPRTVYYILTRNGSSEPVTDVWVRTRRRGGGVNLSKSLDTPVKPLSEIRRLNAYSVIAPDTTEAERREAEKSPIPDEVEIEFTDSAGHEWIRHPNGRLQLLQAPKPTPEPSVKDRLDAFANGQLDEFDT